LGLLDRAEQLRDDKASIIAPTHPPSHVSERIMMTRSFVAKIACLLALSTPAVALAQAETDNEWFKSAYSEQGWKIRAATELRDIFRHAKLDDAARSVEPFVSAAKTGRKIQVDDALRKSITQATTRVAANGGDGAEAERAMNSFFKAFSN
jgi:hypothetical protein